MHRLLMTSTVLAGLVALPALADSTAIGGQEPMSQYASNIDRATVHSVIAPKLPAPPVGANADAQDLLQAALQALAAKRTGMAQEALERAETRLLTRSVPPDQADVPDDGTAVHLISSARLAIAHGDLASADSAIQQAIGALPPDQRTVPSVTRDAVGGEQSDASK